MNKHVSFKLCIIQKFLPTTIVGALELYKIRIQITY
jgi:hypothetical protein